MSAFFWKSSRNDGIFTMTPAFVRGETKPLESTLQTVQVKIKIPWLLRTVTDQGSSLLAGETILELTR